MATDPAALRSCRWVFKVKERLSTKQGRQELRMAERIHYPFTSELKLTLLLYVHYKSRVHYASAVDAEGEQ